MGSAVTASAILIYQNRKSIFGFYKELSDEYNDEGGSSTVDEYGRRSITPDLKKLHSSMALTRKPEEQVGFLTDIMKQLWPYINIAGSDTIRDTAEPMFKEMMPGPLATLHFTKIDLGTVPIRLDNVTIHDVNLEENTLQFDMDVVWDGNCDIKLKADYIGSFGVKSIKMRGRMSILLRPLVPTTSVVAGVQYGFINTPELSLKYSGLAHLADFKVIDQQIQEIMQSVVNGMMVLPRRRLYKMDKGCDYTTIFEPPLGVVRINVMSGRGFEVEKGFLTDDIPDCYCVLTLGDMTHRTSTVMDNLAPEWNETLDFVLSDNDQILQLQCWDEDEGPLDPDDDLGTAVTTPGEILLSGQQLELSLQQDDKPNGAFITVGCEVLKFSSNLQSMSNTNDRQLCGLLTILVLRAFDIPLAKDEAATFVQVTCGDSTFATSAVVDYPGVDCLNPWFDSSFLIELTPARVKDGKISNVEFNLINGVDSDMGKLVITHDDLLAAANNTLAETRPIGSKGAKVQFHVCLQGIEPSAVPTLAEPLSVDSGDFDGVWADVAHDLEMAGASKGSLRGVAHSPLTDVMNHQATPRESTSRGFSSSMDQIEESESFEDAASDQGLVKVTAVSGRGFKVRKTAFFLPDDVPDVYLKVTFGSSPQVWRTKTIQDSSFPVWNESKDYQLASHGQVIDLGVYEDDEKGKEDTYYGSVRVTVGKVLLAGGTTEQEILLEGRGTGSYITVKCQLI